MVLVVIGLCTGKMMSLIDHVEASLVSYVHKEMCNLLSISFFFPHYPATLIIIIIIIICPPVIG